MVRRRRGEKGYVVQHVSASGTGSGARFVYTRQLQTALCLKGRRVWDDRDHAVITKSTGTSGLAGFIVADSD